MDHDDYLDDLDDEDFEDETPKRRGKSKSKVSLAVSSVLGLGIKAAQCHDWKPLSMLIVMFRGGVRVAVRQISDQFHHVVVTFLF